MSSHAFAVGKPFRNFRIVTELPGDEEKPVKKKASRAKVKAFASLNNSSVKIYPDAIKKMIHVVAKENEGKEIDFYVFDLDGTMVKQFKLASHEHIRINGLAKGSYVYRVFSGDLETAAGKFEIR
jgi:hypothetical protein